MQLIHMTSLSLLVNELRVLTDKVASLETFLLYEFPSKSISLFCSEVPLLRQQSFPRLSIAACARNFDVIIDVFPILQTHQELQKLTSQL